MFLCVLHLHIICLFFFFFFLLFRTVHIALRDGQLIAFRTPSPCGSVSWSQQIRTVHIALRDGELIAFRTPSPCGSVSWRQQILRASPLSPPPPPPTPIPVPFCDSHRITSLTSGSACVLTTSSRLALSLLSTGMSSSMLYWDPVSKPAQYKQLLSTANVILCSVLEPGQMACTI